MSKTALWHNGYCESGFGGKRVHAMPSIAGVSPSTMPGLPDRLLANADTAGKEQHQRGACRSRSHHVVSHRVSRGLNFGQLVSGFSSGRSAGRSG